MKEFFKGVAIGFLLGASTMVLIGASVSFDHFTDSVNAMTAIEELVELHKRHWRMTTELHHSREILIPVRVS